MRILEFGLRVVSGVWVQLPEIVTGLFWGPNHNGWGISHLKMLKQWLHMRVSCLCAKKLDFQIDIAECHSFGAVLSLFRTFIMLQMNQNILFDVVSLLLEVSCGSCQFIPLMVIG